MRCLGASLPKYVQQVVDRPKIPGTRSLMGGKPRGGNERDVGVCSINKIHPRYNVNLLFLKIVGTKTEAV